VARGLVDAPLAPELRLDRLDRDAVRLHAAVAAALADRLVDDDAPVGVGELAALAQAARLGRAGLVVDERRDTRVPAQRALHAVELVAVMARDAVGEGAPRVFLDVVADAGDPPDALGVELARDLRRRPLALDRLALDRLPAGHRDGAVHQDLEGDVDLGGDRGPDREQPR